MSAIDLASLPCPHCELPIPEDVVPNSRWSPLMVEIADHIGARPTLILVDRFGGQELLIAKNPARSPFRNAIGEKAADELARVFGGERVKLPVGRLALMHARRQGVLARVREGRLTLTDAARALRTSRHFVQQLINGSDEGFE